MSVCVEVSIQTGEWHYLRHKIITRSMVRVLGLVRWFVVEVCGYFVKAEKLLFVLSDLKKLFEILAMLITLSFKFSS